MAQQGNVPSLDCPELSKPFFPKSTFILLPLSVIGLLAPFILASGQAPSWFVGLIKGSDGEGVGFQILGAMALCGATINILQWGGARFSMSSLTRTGEWLRQSVIAVMLLGGLAFVAIISAVLLGLLVPWLTRILPDTISVYLRGLDREPGSLILAGIIAMLIVAIAGFTRLRARKNDPDKTGIESISDAALEALHPPLLLGLIALKAFVWFGLLLLAVTEWFPQYIGIPAIWAKANYAQILGSIMVISVLSPFALYVLRIAKNTDPDRKPTFSESCDSVFLILTVIALVIIAVALLIGLVRS